ncbi:MAG: T9SS type A sorting domain-containing protein, partial [Deltaproteobacteria bacterium]|nr:T9SS type A sorting domain-containing protein [Deltaproteobacteria bacterium]
LNGIFECTWSIDHWVYNSMDTNHISYSGRTVLTEGRNDGKNRLYVASDLWESADSIGYTNVYILEKTYDSLAGWTRKDLQAVFFGDPVPLDYIAAGQARNDGVNRIYGHCYYGELFEFAWDDTLNGVEQEGLKVINDLKVTKVLKVGPNPFCNYTTISNLPTDAELKIYDITGRLVEKTNSAKVGSKLKAGVYFITAGGYKPAKMVKIK